MRLFVVVLIGISLLTLISACGGEPSATSQQETPTGTVDTNFDIGALMSGLIEQGVAVGLGSELTQPFFSVSGQTIIVNQESAQVFTYPSPGAARSEADLVDPTGFTVGTTSISWVAPPHFYLKESLLVLYVGNNGPFIELLETVLGTQFAGAGNTAVDPNSYTDAQVQGYLALMDELASVLSRFSRSGNPRASTESITTLTTKLENYTASFAELDGEAIDYVSETYGDQLRQSGERVANIAVTIQENLGNELIAQALARIPSFAIASVTSNPAEPSLIVVSGHINTLLLPGEVAALAGGVELKTQYLDHKSRAANEDPSQFEHVFSFESLNFDTEDRIRELTLTEIDPSSSFATPDGFMGLTLTAIRLESAGAATDQMRLITGEGSGMEDLLETIGDASVFIDANEAGIGSMVVFKKGEWVVIVHTAQPDGVTPLVDLAGVEALARIVANRL